MTWKQSTRFSYNGVSSDTYGIYNVLVSTMGTMYLPYQETVFSTNLLETTTRYKDIPYLQGVKRTPLSLNVQWSLPENGWDDDTLKEILRWLYVDTPRELIFSDYPDTIYFCMPTGDVQLFHAGLKQGYINITFRCNAPYAFTPTFTESFDLSNNPNGTTIQLVNNGDLTIKPTLNITKVGAGQLSIVNQSNGGQNFQYNAGAQASGNISFMGTVYDGEELLIDSKIYEWDTDGTTYNGNIPLSVSATKASAKLTFTGNVTDGETVTIGSSSTTSNISSDVYEFDWDNSLSTTANIKVDISQYVAKAQWKITVNNLPEPGNIFSVSGKDYSFETGTNPNYIRITGHGINVDGTFGAIVLNTNRDSTKTGYRFVKALTPDYLKTFSLTTSQPQSISYQVNGDIIEIFKPTRTGYINVNRTSSTSSSIVLNTPLGVGEIVSNDIIMIMDLAANTSEVGQVSSASGNTITLSSALQAVNVSSTSANLVVMPYHMVTSTVAEQANMSIANAVLVGTDQVSTAQNIMFAINAPAGSGGSTFGTSTFANTVFTASASSDMTVANVNATTNIFYLNAINYGYDTTIVSFNGTVANITCQKLTNGASCTTANALTALVTAINVKNTPPPQTSPVALDPNGIYQLPVNLYVSASYTSGNNYMTVTAKAGGTIGNTITVSTTCLYGSWGKDLNGNPVVTLLGGTDPLISDCMNALKTALNANEPNLTVTINSTTNKMTLTYNTIGAVGNIATVSYSKYVLPDYSLLTGGMDQLVDGEVLTVDCDNEYIGTNQTGIFRYDVFNGNYLELLRGVNQLFITGDCKITFTWRCKVLQ